MQMYSVQSTLPKGPKKQVTLVDGKKRHVYIMVPRFASVGKSDQVVIDPAHPNSIFCKSSEENSDLIRISPHYENSGKASVGSMSFNFRTTEVDRQEDIDSLTYLEQFHYKSFTDVDQGVQVDELMPATRSKTASVGGRKAVILLYICLFGQWQAAGYIELQMPLMMCKPRHSLFANPFCHSKRPISWSTWDQHAIKKYVNTIVRIARVVVNPEFRGLGLARILISASKEFCMARWHISGKRPIFMEISAEMLNYIDFVSSSGFMYVDRTEGNAARVVKDLSHMQKGYAVSSGIMSLQKRYLSALQAYCKETKRSIKEALDRLEEVLSTDDPTEVLSPVEWAAFRKVLRQRIPYYLCPLDEDTAGYLRPLLRGRKSPSVKPNFSVGGARIDLKAISVRSVVPLPMTRNVRIIMDAFGLGGDAIDCQLLPPTPIRASAGNIIFIVGASGAGKSALLRALDPSVGYDSGFEVRSNSQRNYTCGWLKALPESTPLFDYFAEKYSPERAFSALSQVGLSEAFVLVKPFKLLSRGQQYRAMLADLLLREEQVWLLDEFCADLDPVTARIVAHNFRRNVISSNRIAFVAAANHAHYVDALRPTQVIQLKTGGQPRILSFKDYRDELFQQAV